MRRLIVSGVAGFLLYSGVAFGDLLWSRQQPPLLTWGSADVVNTAQFYCSQLKEHGREDWRLPTESELLNQAPKDLKGIFWSANGIPFPVKRKAMAIAVDVGHKLPLFREPHSKQLVICTNDQF